MHRRKTEAKAVKKEKLEGLMVFGMLAALMALCLLSGGGEEAKPLSYGEFWQMAENGGVAEVTMGDGENWDVLLRDGQKAVTPNPRAEDGKERLLRLGVSVREQGQSPVPGLMFLGLLLCCVLLLTRGRKGTAGMAKYAAVQADEHIPDVTFEDVAVSPQTLQSMRDLVGFLREPERYAACGARPPKGVMLYGPPGTGKTLLARALAGEAKAPFFAMSGADFVQVYVGVGASRVRELFRKARKAGGGVIFIDEIDAIGKKRDSGNDEREQTLNALLTEMSGFSGGDKIMVVAATNRLDTLDTALLREGRFDRRIEVGLPDREERLRILQVHARNKPLAPDACLETVAAQTALFSGAQLETLLNEAAIRAARAGCQAITMEHLQQAFFAVTAGEDRPRQFSEAEKRITAYHEAGHALLTHVLQPEARLTRVSIIPTSRGAAGYSMHVQPDKLLHTKKELIAMMAVALGGRLAEEMLLGKDNVTTGAANDLEKVREISRCMAEDWAMGETGDMKSDRAALEEEARLLGTSTLARCRAGLDALAKALMERESLDGDSVIHILGAQKEA